VVFGNSDGQIWGLVQRAIRDAGFRSVPVHIAILDKGQRSVKGLNSGSEGVVTVDLVVTLQKPAQPSQASNDSKLLIQADAGKLIAHAMQILPAKARNPSHVYAAILRDAISQHQMVDHLHLSDVLIALRNEGYVIDRKTGLLTENDPTVILAAE
jgi:hypothetical protein